MVPVLMGNSGGVNVRVHMVVRRVGGHSHQVPKVSNKHIIAMHLTGTTAGCSSFPGPLQILIHRLGKAGNGPQFIELAANTVDYQPNMDVLNCLQSSGMKTRRMTLVLLALSIVVPTRLKLFSQTKLMK